MKVPSTRPFFTEEDISAITQDIAAVLRSGRLILGPHTKRLEEAFAAYCGVRRAVGVSSCSAALEIALRFYEVAGREVIVPTNTFVATANAVVYAGGKPVLADMRPETLCLDPADVMDRITHRTAGVIVVHISGLPCPHVEELRSLCRKKGIFLLEDCAHAHGAAIGGKKAGSFGNAGCFSFYPTKVMTTGTGGMVTTDDDALADYALSLRHHGVGKGLHHIVNLGNDWLMSEVDAVIGYYQLKSLDLNLERRDAIARRYDEALAGADLVQTFRLPADARHAYYKYPVLLSDSVDKKKLAEMLKSEHGIEIGSVYDPPCHLQPAYQRIFGYREGMFPNADSTLKRTACLPIFPQMQAEEVDYVMGCLKASLPLCATGQPVASEVK